MVIKLSLPSPKSGGFQVDTSLSPNKSEGSQPRSGFSIYVEPPIGAPIEIGIEIEPEIEIEVEV